MENVLATINADPSREIDCEKWMQDVYLPHLKANNVAVDDDDVDPDYCIQFVIQVGRMPSSPQELDDFVAGNGEFSHGVANLQEVMSEEQCDKEFQSALRRINHYWASVTDGNYGFAGGYLDAVTYRIAANPHRKAKNLGRIARSVAIGELVNGELDRYADDVKEGESADAAEKRKKKAATNRINTFVQAGAAMRLIFGARVGSEVVSHDGRAVSRSSKKHPPLSWRMASLFFPLVYRVHADEFEPEEWAIIQGVEEEVRGLHDQLFKEKLPYDAVRIRAGEIRVKSLEFRAEKGDAYARDALVKIAEKKKEEEKKAGTTPTSPAAPTTPAVGDPVKPSVEEQQKRIEAEQEEEPVDADYTQATLEACQVMIDAVEHAEEPDTALELAMDALSESDHLSGNFKRACKAFCLLVKRKDA